MSSSPEEAFIAAFEEYADALFRHAYFRLSSRERANDLTQETFLKTWDYVRGGSTVKHWKSFLYRVMNNLIIDEYRRKKETSLDALIENESIPTDAPLAVDSREEREGRLDEELLIGKVRAVMEGLSERERTVLTLRYVDGLSPKEIAVSLDISENAASVRIHRAVEELRRRCLPFINL